MPVDTEALTAASAAAAAPEPEPDASTLSLDQALSALEKVRKESAGRRVEHAPFKDAFNNLDAGERDFVLDAIKAIKQGDGSAGAKQWLDFGKQIAGEDIYNEWVGTAAETIAAVQEAANAVTQDKPAIPAPVAAPVPAAAPAVDVNKIVADAVSAAVQGVTRSQADRDNQVQAVAYQKEAEGLGFTRDTPQYRALFDIAIADGLTLPEAKESYDKTFGNAPKAPAVPKTAAAGQGSGSVVASEKDERPAVDKLEELVARSIKEG